MYQGVKVSYNPEAEWREAVELPLSKSISARVACLDFLAGGEVRMHPSPSEDEMLIAQALNDLNHLKAPKLFIGESGTALRLLTAIIASTPGLSAVLQGRGRLLSRPMRPLIDALTQLDATAPEALPDGLLIRGYQLKTNGLINIDPTLSSQFITVLMLIGPRVKGGLQLAFDRPPVSEPYINMTLGAMLRYGVQVWKEVDASSPGEYHCRISIAEGEYSYVADYMSEPCFSSASYFYELAALTGRKLSMKSLVLPSESLQGDARCESIFSHLGVRTDRQNGELILTPGGERVDCLKCDMSDTPDLVPAVVATCAALGIPFELSGVAHLRHKESDRIAMLSSQLERMGLKLSIKSGILSSPGGKLQMPDGDLKTAADHRLAMAFAPLATRFPLTLDCRPSVVAKSFPSFWQEAAKIGLTTRDINL